MFFNRAKAVDVIYTSDINAILEVEVKVVSTGKIRIPGADR